MRAPFLPLTLLLLVIEVAPQCNVHYYSANGTCLQCDFSCYNCSDSPTNCTSCQEGSYLSGNACLPCNSSCIDCLNLLQCKACQLTFRLASQKCLPCGPNCDFCSNSACTICSGGYDLKSNCSNCTGGFYWNTSRSSCLLCGVGCSNCNHTHCLACRDNYEYRNESCYPTQRNSPNEGHEEQEDQSQLHTEIILASVLGGAFILGIVAYGLYRVCWSPSRNGGSSSRKIGGSVGEVGICKSDSINQDLTNYNCLICSSGQCDVVFSCGHNYHARCLQGRECNLCKQNIKETPIFLQDVLRGSDAASDASSSLSRKDAYREAFSCDSILQQSHVEVQ